MSIKIEPFKNNIGASIVCDLKSIKVNSFHNYVVTGKNKNIIILARSIKDQTIELNI